MKLPDALHQPVAEWVSEVLGSVQPTNSESLYTDELAKRAELVGQSTLEIAWSGYRALLSVLAENVERYMAVLSIPSKDSQVLDPQVPDFSDLERLMSSEPPSIYIVDRRMALLLENNERYQCPLPKMQLFAIELPNVEFLFVCNRSAFGRDQEWEFGRYLSAEHYPPSFRPKA